MSEIEFHLFCPPLIEHQSLLKSPSIWAILNRLERSNPSTGGGAISDPALEPASDLEPPLVALTHLTHDKMHSENASHFYSEAVSTQIHRKNLTEKPPKRAPRHPSKNRTDTRICRNRTDCKISRSLHSAASDDFPFPSFTPKRNFHSLTSEGFPPLSGENERERVSARLFVFRVRASNNNSNWWHFLTGSIASGSRERFVTHSLKTE